MRAFFVEGFEFFCQRAGFGDVSADLGINRAALARIAAVLQCIAIAERGAAAGRDENTFLHRGPGVQKFDECEFNSPSTG